MKDETELRYKVDLLLACTCIVYEPVEDIAFIPIEGESRMCETHGNTSIKKVGYPFPTVSLKQYEKTPRN